MNDVTRKLLNALKEADKEFTECFDSDAICDHSVGICSCGYHTMRERMRQAIEFAESQP